jgi:hypothetical protein
MDALELDKAVLERSREIAPIQVDIPLLERIPVEVVQLGPRRLNQLVTTGAQRSKRTPPEPQWVLRLGIRFEFDSLWLPMQHPGKALAVDRTARHAEEIEHRGHDVNESHDVSYPARRHVGGANDERDAQHTLVHEDSVIALAVIAQRLSVIGSHDHYRSIQELPTIEGFQQSADLRVGEGYLGGIGIRVSRSERFGRVVGSVRVVQVGPDEERRAVDPFDPPYGFSDNFIPSSASRRSGRSFGCPGIDYAAVRVEALCEPSVCIEHDGSDERAGAEPVRAQGLGERCVLRRERWIGIVSDTMGRWKESREQAAVRRQRERRHRCRLIKNDPLAREPIEMRHRRIHEAIGRQAVGASRIERNDDDADGRWRLMKRTPPGSPNARYQQEYDGCDPRRDEAFDGGLVVAHDHN